jgi:hypothetical protein
VEFDKQNKCVIIYNHIATILGGRLACKELIISTANAGGWSELGKRQLVETTDRIISMI